MKRLILVAMTMVAVLGFAASTEAAAITGDVGFAGNANPSGGSNWGTATGVAFANGTIFTTAGNTGTFSTVPQGVATTFTNFTFTPSLLPSPVSPLWTFTYLGIDYSFDMSSVAIISQTTTSSTSSSLVLHGTGVMTSTGFGPANGIFDFSANQTGTRFNFSATTAATNPVPEPGTMVLFGTGLLGLAAIARRRLVKP